ncbi:hypothetical protein [Lutibacter sp.]
MKKLEIKIPIIHIIAIILFVIIVNIVIGKETQGRSEIFGVVYSLSFFMTHDIYSIILGVILIIPLPLLIFSIIKKRKDLIKGFLISTLTSILLLTVVSIF